MSEKLPAYTDSVASEVRAWLAAHWIPERPLGEWWQLLSDSGWGFPHHPVEWFGRGLTAAERSVVAAEFDRVGAYGPPKGIATMMVAPMLIELGSDLQKRDWLPGIVNGTDTWCQLFSEPGAGSDLASLATRAVRDGERWIVNGQKVWTSGGHYARRAILLARSNGDVAKHRGLTFFVVEMDQPGIDVRPLIQMTGDAEFNEVFLTDCEVDARNVIGEIDGGWGVALRLLSHERASLDPDAPQGLQHELDLAVEAGRYASGEADDGMSGFMPAARRLGRCCSTCCSDREAPAIRWLANEWCGFIRCCRWPGGVRCDPVRPRLRGGRSGPRCPSASWPAVG